MGWRSWERASGGCDLDTSRVWSLPFPLPDASSALHVISGLLDITRLFSAALPRWRPHRASIVVKTGARDH
jgi:hypothetical protein